MRRLWEATSTVPIHHSVGTPLHAKTMVVERILALIGITNLDNHCFAFEFNEEINSSCTTPLSPVSLKKRLLRRSEAFEKVDRLMSSLACRHVT